MTPLDFLDQPIEVGDKIVYPTGGSSGRLILARVVAIDEYEDLVQQRRLASYNVPYNGWRGKAKYRLKVNRIREGSGLNFVDTDRAVFVSQTHRAIKVP